MMKGTSGNDSSFNPSMPATDPTIAPKPDHHKPQPGHETLLVIEDDDSVREYTARMLGTLGYRVFSASDGQTAIELFKSQASQINMVITDMIMPNMSGDQFVEAVRQFDKDMKILFVSGYSPYDTGKGMILGPSVAFLEKPYSREQLSKKIREVLDGKKQ